MRGSPQTAVAIPWIFRKLTIAKAVNLVRNHLQFSTSMHLCAAMGDCHVALRAPRNDVVFWCLLTSIDSATNINLLPMLGELHDHNL